MFGLKSLNNDELEKICNHKKKRITMVHRKAQRVLNVAKQKKVISITN